MSAIGVFSAIVGVLTLITVATGLLAIMPTENKGKRNNYVLWSAGMSGILTAFLMLNFLTFASKLIEAINT